MKKMLLIAGVMISGQALGLELHGNEPERKIVSPEQALVQRFGSQVEKIAEGVYVVAHSDKERTTYAFGLEGFRYELNRVEQRLQQLDHAKIEKTSSQYQHYQAISEALSEEVDVQSKGLRTGEACDGSFPWELFWAYATGTNGKYAVGRAEIEENPFIGPPPPNPYFKAQSWVYLEWPSGDSSDSDSDEGHNGASSEARVDCPVGTTCTFYEAELIVRAWTNYGVWPACPGGLARPEVLL